MLATSFAQQKWCWSLVALVLLATPVLGTQTALAVHTAIGLPGVRPSRVRRFWTPARMQHARPLAIAPPSGSTPRRVASAAASSAPETIVEPASAGYSRYGAVFGVDSKGEAFRCSGTSVAAPNSSLVITAGHCVHDEGRWSSRKFIFVPGYRYGERPLGVFAARWLGTTPAWLAHENSNFDVGMAVVGRNERGQTLAAAAGADRFASGLPPGQSFDVYGYPVARPFTGATLQRCPQTSYEGPDLGSFFASGPLDLAVQCNLSPGSSGGAWVIDGNRIDGVTSYGYNEDPGTDYGPYFGRGIARLYARAGRAR